MHVAMPRRLDAIDAAYGSRERAAAVVIPRRDRTIRAGNRCKMAKL